jgi:hypothetical protein
MVLKNSLSDKEIQEIESHFGKKEMSFLTIQQVIEMQKNKQLQSA